MGDPTVTLNKRLEIRSTQSGIAGETGTRWVIEPGGGWKVEQIQTGIPNVTVATGQLSADELAKLREALTLNQVETLPNKFDEPRTNPSKLVIRWGDRETMLTAPGGVDLMDAHAVVSTARNLPDKQAQAVAIARSVQVLTDN